MSLMGEMKNLQPGDLGWNFMERIRAHNMKIDERRRLLWRSLPQWRLILHFLGFRKQADSAYYDDSWRLWGIECWPSMPRWRRLLWEVGIDKPALRWFRSVRDTGT
jgi:hypothetical protein